MYYLSIFEMQLGKRVSRVRERVRMNARETRGLVESELDERVGAGERGGAQVAQVRGVEQETAQTRQVGERVIVERCQRVVAQVEELEARQVAERVAIETREPVAREHKRAQVRIAVERERLHRVQRGTLLHADLVERLVHHKGRQHVSAQRVGVGVGARGHVALRQFARPHGARRVMMQRLRVVEAGEERRRVHVQLVDERVVEGRVVQVLVAHVEQVDDVGAQAAKRSPHRPHVEVRVGETKLEQRTVATRRRRRRRRRRRLGRQRRRSRRRRRRGTGGGRGQLVRETRVGERERLEGAVFDVDDVVEVEMKGGHELALQALQVALVGDVER